jgi:hypothetical protein
MSDLDRTTVENALIGQEFELSWPAAAHAAIEARSTTGKTLLAVSPVTARPRLSVITTPSAAVLTARLSLPGRE